jgi:hypothetical protein
MLLGCVNFPLLLQNTFSIFGICDKITFGSQLQRFQFSWLLGLIALGPYW